MLAIDANGIPVQMSANEADVQFRKATSEPEVMPSLPDAPESWRKTDGAERNRSSHHRAVDIFMTTPYRPRQRRAEMSGVSFDMSRGFVRSLT
ncbi:hypothetical protein PY650_08450 [Rhizobium calliandrae]|uniref:Uncharacterized protein n=1 Tax=Rhizobium calliandrae TaxID=1312182 RepID=A0ABT7KAP8_9HYPH|nr:hypothetical protein [Rhizobium calliandrae]MDL2405696.1 hypothetical protein [Rhizobium calliandrae]